MTFVSLALILALQTPGGAPAKPAPAAVPAPAAKTVKAPASSESLDEMKAALDELRATLEAERRRFAEQEAALRKELDSLKEELARVLDERLAREREWLSYTKALQGAMPGDVRFEPEVPEGEKAGDPGAPSEAPADGEPALSDSGETKESTAAGDSQQDAAVDGSARSREVLIALRSLIVTEQIGGIDLLTVGNVHDGYTGPVVMRVLDDWGRPLGSITAERMRLEGSRAARTLTIVLEEGYERRMGERIPFAGSGGRNVRRMVLPHVDPAPWIEDLPELFDDASFAPPADDGKWDLGHVRMTLNTLLRLDAANGWYRVRILGGVQGQVLRNVMLEELDPDGRLERRLFADRIEVVPQERGMLLLCLGGAQERAGRKTPFLEGRYRIYLPRADGARWQESRIPIVDAATPAHPIEREATIGEATAGTAEASAGTATETAKASTANKGDG